MTDPAPGIAAGMRLTAGDRLGPYEIVAPLGAGGMGEVYRARDTRLGREVAIKIISNRVAGDPHSLRRFEQEAKAVAALSHPNILAIHDFGTHRGISFVVMELLRGESLADRLAREHLSWRTAVEIAAAVADGVASAHAQGIIHRDLKPANIFLTNDGQVKILDFGLAKRQKLDDSVRSSIETESQSDVVVGTIGYMAPEQISGSHVDARVDIFALGCILYEMLTGERAFRRVSAAETLAAILRDNPTDPLDSGKRFPLALAHIVMRCLQKNPDERFQSARDLSFALRAVTDTRGVRIPKVVWIAASILLVAAAIGVLLRSRTSPSPQPLHSIAVLPFVNVSRDPDAEYLSDGITETLIDNLSEIGGLRVIPSASVFRFKGTNDFHDAASKLHVNAVVTGRALRRGDTLSVQAELIDVNADRQLWGGKYEKRMEDLLIVQSEISHDITEHLRVRISPEDRRRLTRPTTTNPAAYEAYLRGRYFWNKRNVDAIRKSIDYFQQAIDIDPTYALAYTGLSDGYGLLGDHYYGGAPPTEAMPRAKAAALKALQLDPSLGEAHASLGWVLAQYDWNLPASEAEFRRAISLNPNYATAHAWLAITLISERKYNEAIAEMARAHELDPLSSIISFQVGYMYYLARRYPEAEQHELLARDLDRAFYKIFQMLAMIHVQMGETKQAVADAQEMVRLSNGMIPLTHLARAYAAAGERSDATKIVDDVLRFSEKRYIPSYYIATIYAALGDRNEAFTYLERSFQEHSSAMILLRIEPALDPLRSDPRFANLMRRVDQSVR